jgi:DNA-binding NarL/FixJ family response regulator
MEKQKVFIIDDSDVARAMLKNILKGDDLVEIVGEEKTGIGAIIMLEELKPDVVLLEANISGDIKLVDVIKEIRKLDTHVKIVICADAISRYELIDAPSVGADDIIAKPYRKQEIYRILRSYEEGA